jgi:FkbM family methyltransferase
MQMRLRTWFRKYPRLKARLLPIYTRTLSLRWKLRNLVTRRSPIIFSIGQHYLRLYPDGMILQSIYDGYFEIVERNFVEVYLQPGMTVVDAGANVGLYTIMASALVGVSGRVFAFEPSQLTFDRLQRNLDINQCQNVIAAHAALSNTHEQMILRIDPNHPVLDGHRFVLPMREVVHPTHTDEIVDCQMLDDYFLFCDFLKIDVEGAELAVLKGAENILARSTDITILLECTQNRVQVWDLLSQHGFQSFVWDNTKQALQLVAFEDVVATSNIILRRQPWTKK